MADIILIILYYLLAVVWIVLLAKGSKKFAEMIEPLDKKKNPLKQCH